MKYIFNFKKKEYTCVGNRRATFNDIETLDEFNYFAALIVGGAVHEVEFSNPNDTFTKECIEKVCKEAPKWRPPDVYFEYMEQQGYERGVSKSGLPYLKV
ncbi:MAG: hypothetical protein KKD65_12845 [Gammaproteobacteria bacterium]|nr:hypothetical protein [Gammaproteobacteria bacterium]